MTTLEQRLREAGFGEMDIIIIIGHTKEWIQQQQPIVFTNKETGQIIDVLDKNELLKECLKENEM